MYKNLKAEIARSGMSVAEVAQKVGIKERTLRNHMTGRTPFTVGEAVTIRSLCFPDMSLDYLFDNSESGGNASGSATAEVQQ